MNNPNSQIANQRPMQRMADQMATQGRYGDSMMVHMNPVEVQGLASLSPTGSLTRNPMTGQPEAFLPFLAPLLGGMLGSAGFTALGGALGAGALGSAATALGANAALAGAVGSGLATTAVTGDLKQGIMSGLTGYGIGSAVNAASSALNPAVAGAKSALAGSEKALADATLATSGVENLAADAQIAALKAPISTQANSALSAPQMSPVANPLESSAVMSSSPNPQISSSVSTTMNPESIAYKQSMLQDAQAQATRDISKNFSSDPMKFTGEFGKNLMTKGSILPVAIGEGARAQEMLEDDMRADSRRRQGESEQELSDAYAGYNSAVARGRAINDMNPNSINPYYGSYEDNNPYQSASGGQINMMGGGVTSINPQDYMRQRQNLESMGQPVRMFSGMTIPDFSGMNNKDAEEAQALVRPPRAVTTEELEAEANARVAQGQDPRAGFAPEMRYFREPLPDPVVEPDPDAPVEGGEGKTPVFTMPNKGGNFDFSKMPNVAMRGPETAMREGRNPAGMGGIEQIATNKMIMDAEKAKERANQAVEGLSNDYMRDYGNSVVPIYGNQMRGGGIVSLQEGGMPQMSPEFNNPATSQNAMVAGASMAAQDQMMGQQGPQMSQEEIMSVISEVTSIAKSDPDGSKGDPQRYQELSAQLLRIREQIGDQALAQIINSMTGQGASAGVSMEDMNVQVNPQPTYDYAEGGMTQGSETELLNQTRQAILGQLSPEQSEAVINMFVDTYGSEVFAELRTSVLQSVVPNAQTEGKIEGQGGGMDDEVMGMIGNQQQVAVSPDEYIVPADVVSGIGDGSSSAGADQLDEMLDRVRSARTGTTQQPSPVMARQGGMLPA